MKEWNSADFTKDLREESQRFSRPPALTDVSRKAAARAMKLLLYKGRTEQELRNRLLQEGFPEQQVDDAITYCKSFGYINDEKYAENFIVSMKSRKSQRMIRRELEDKGVLSADIEQAFGEIPYEEGELIYQLIIKKAGDPHQMDDKELRRTYAFLARKGFSSSKIWKALHTFQEEPEG
ncbi:MAG: regulatory protein RecX [Bilifractor sp.]|jgi:regulatory protein|nr:recombination regulator RecX [Lachnospiraceae bacterium]MDY2837709.1 regulatory protein RecX [Bilifractor sp.]